MTNTIVARRYASALFALGRKQGTDALDAHGQCLFELAGMVGAEPKLALALKSPAIGTGEKKTLLGALLEKLPADQTMRNFCFLLADKQRLGALREIARQYGKLLDEANGVMRGKVITAIELTDAKKENVRRSLKEKFGGDMELVFDVDPEILGGMTLTVGDKVLDSSLRAQLGIMRETLKRGI